MFRNIAAAAIRHLSRNKLYNGLTILGLAVGFAVAILAFLYVRNEYSYDRGVPDAGQVYRVSETHTQPGEKAVVSDIVSAHLGGDLKLDFPQILYEARLDGSGASPTVQHGRQISKEFNLVWADPDFFRIIPLPKVAGDLDQALRVSDGVVVTRSISRKYFGEGDAIGQVILIDQHPFRVMAVIQDLPSNTHLAANVYASALSPFSDLKHQERVDTPLNETVATYVKLRPGATAPDLGGYMSRRYSQIALGGVGARMTAELTPLTDIHFRHPTQGAFKPPGDKGVDGAIAAVGLLIIVIAAINFVTLMTARASHRAVEVGVRKAAGADRRQLIMQFMGEALLYVVIAGVIGAALAELALPAFDSLVQRRITFHYLTDPWLLGGVLVTVIVTAVLAGAYPALVLSSFPPSVVLRGGVTKLGGAIGRQVLVVAQFAVVIGLVLFALTLSRQTLFGLNEGMRIDKSNVLLLAAEPCTDRLRDAVMQVPGVQQASCASAGVLGMGDNPTSASIDGRSQTVMLAPVDFDFFKTFHLPMLAGRDFDRNRPADDFSARSPSNPPVIINETAMRKFGFASPAAAVGRTVSWVFHTDFDTAYGNDPAKLSDIVGVVPDFTFGSMRNQIQPTLYMLGPKASYYAMALSIRVNPKMALQAGRGIDEVWRRLGDGSAAQRATVTFFTLRLYMDAIAQGQTVVIATLVAVLVACLGLFALSAYTTERRTKEIGIRKAMGASSVDIVGRLLWEFTKPVLLANIVVAPVALWLLSWWLSGFAYHVSISAWSFAIAACVSLLIAWATVLFHSIRVARARPVNALRYE